MSLLLLAFASVTLANDVIDHTDRVSYELCVEYKRPRRAETSAPTRTAVDLVPEAWARARAALGRNRQPTGVFDPSEFAAFVPQQDPAPVGDSPVAMNIETAPHPLHPDRMLVRVGLQSPPPHRGPVHLVVLVNIAASMGSVSARGYPMFQDTLPPREPGEFVYPKVNRLSLVRRSLLELVSELPDQSLVALGVFGGGARVVLEPTSMSQREVVASAIDTLGTDLSGTERGLNVVTRLLSRMHQYCGDTQVLVFSDGPTGLGGDPDEAMAEVARLAARGVNVSTVAPALGEQRVAQLEHLAWVGYGQHYYTDTLSDALSAFQRTLERPGWIARDVSVQVAFDSDAVTEVRTVSGDGLAWFFEGLERGRSHGALYEVTLAEGTDTDRFMDVSWTAGSPVPGEWKRSGHRAIERAELSTRFEEAPAGVRLSWIAASFAMHLEGREINPGLETLLEMARDARREAVRSDVELIALIDRAIRAE